MATAVKGRGTKGGLPPREKKATVVGSNTGSRHVGRKKLGQNQNAPAIAREFGAHLQRLLDERKLTVDKYSERCEAVGLSKAPSTIWAMLRAESTPPMKDLPLMAKALRLKDWRDLIPPKPGT